MRNTYYYTLCQIENIFILNITFIYAIHTYYAYILYILYYTIHTLLYYTYFTRLAFNSQNYSSNNTLTIKSQKLFYFLNSQNKMC
jgi:hypothetical protein